MVIRVMPSDILHSLYISDMQTFIREVAEFVYKKHAKSLDKVTVIFPNRRAGLFFRQSLGQLISEPIWMPSITSLEDFIVYHSGLKKVETLEAVFSLYEVYKQHQKKEETFDQFFFWGEMILRDFDEIDQYLVEADNLFTSIKSQKELDEEFYFLDDEEMKAIRSFWSTFLPEASKSQQTFLETWKLLKPIYHSYKERMKSQKVGYGGLIYREFLQRLESKEFTFPNRLVLAGFNALTKTEEQIIKRLIDEHDAEMLWDLDDYYMKDGNQEAGFFMRAYAKDSILGKTFPSDYPKRINTPKKLLATGVSLEVGQTKAMAEHLAEIMQSADFQPEKTVIVLPNEYMLFPVLHSLPEEVKDLNITMGYPLKDTPVFSLIESLLQLQKSRRSSVVHGHSFGHRPVIEILEHPLIHPLNPKAISALVGDIKKRNLIFLYHDELPKDPPVFTLIFDRPTQPLIYLLDILKALHGFWKERGHDLELEFLSRFYQHIAKLKEMIGDKVAQLSYDFLIRLFRRLSRSLKIPFTGEPLHGLQLMGVLETRNLDFENVFILNMNEASWPAAPKKGSFLPYNIRKAFDLPVFEHQDAIYAYLFYRLLQRTKKVWFYYNTVSEFNVNGELSRLVQQLEYESDHTIEKRILANPIEISPPKSISIAKGPEVMEKLRNYVVKPGEWSRRFTPSALDTYLYCRLRFYFKYIQELYEPDELQEELSPMVFGNILHDTMEILYDQFIKKQKKDVIEAHDFFWLQEGIDGALNKAFVKHYDVKNEDKFQLEGRNIIAAEIIKKTVRKILSFDQQYAPFRILGLETSTKDGYKVDFPVTINGVEEEIGIKGKIDRIDSKHGRVRVIDYKTGKDAKEFTTVASLIDREDEKRNKAVFQVFFYSYLFYKTHKGPYESIEPGLFNSRDLFDSNFNWQLVDKSGKHPGQVREFRQYLEEFEEIVTSLLTEIYDEAIPFDQVKDERKCRFCPYKGICNRG